MVTYADIIKEVNLILKKEYPNVKRYGNDTVEQGTEGGGNIEVYANVEDAKARDEYLSLFDKATAINPGSHELYGTVIIRVSKYLTATQQKELTQQILQKLIEVR